MKLYCGIDLHANNSVISIHDEQDKVHYEEGIGVKARIGVRSCILPFFS